MSRMASSLGFETDVFPFEVAHHADDAHVLVHRHCTVFLQVIQNFIEMLYIIDRNGHPLRSTNHIDRSLVAFEYFKTLRKKP